MKTLRTVLAAAALAVALTSCAVGTGAPAPSGAAAPAPAPAGAAPAPAPGPAPATSSATGEEAVVEDVFRRYYQALLARDFPTACRLNAPETTAALLENLAAQGVAAGSCEEAYGTILAVPAAAEAAAGIARTTRIQRVTVDGDSATVSWSAEAQGRRRTVDSGLRRTDGEWKLLATTA